MQDKYYAKYLKYKNKYLELKGGITLDNGDYAYFSKDLTYLKQGSAPSVGDIENKLSNIAYRIKYGTDELELIFNEDAEKKKQGEYATLKRNGPNTIYLDMAFDGSEQSINKVKSKIFIETKNKIPVNSYFKIKINKLLFNKVEEVKAFTPITA